MKIQSKDMTERYFIKPNIYTDGGRITFYYNKMLSELFKAYDSLKKTKKKLADSEKEALAGQISAGVAHEIKNPLAVIISGLEYLERKMSKEEVMVGLINNMMVSAQRANTTVTDMLDITRAPTVNMEKVNLNDVIQRSISANNALALETVTVNFNPCEHAPILMADGSIFMQVIDNLVVNAANSMNENMPDLTPQEKEVSVNTTFDDDFFHVRVLDNGIGFTEKIMDKIFDPFATTRRANGGSGLGMCLVKQIVELHRGSVTVANRPEGGADVHLTIPLHQKSPLDE